MATVKTRKMRLELDPANMWRETVVAVKYDATDKRTANYSHDIPELRFYIELPAVVAGPLGVSKARGATQEEAFAAFEELIKKYKALKVEKNQVILYHIETVPNTDKEYTSRWGSSSGSGALQITFWAGTYEETVNTAGDGVTKRYSYIGVESSLAMGSGYGPNARTDGQRYKRQVPWTDQNEKFFFWVQQHMNQLIVKLGELTDTSYLIDAIAAGRLLPLGEEKPNAKD